MEPIISKFPYHKKFEKVLNDGNRQAVDAAFEEFCSLKTNAAYRRLWHLTCDGRVIGITLEKMGLADWPRKNVELLRNELQYQYEKMHKGCFSTKKLIESWLIAYRALVKQVGPIVAKTVLVRCQATLAMDRNIVWKVIGLLDNERPEYYFGGLRQMGFSYEEAHYLVHYRKYIRELLVAMREK